MACFIEQGQSLFQSSDVPGREEEGLLRPMKVTLGPEFSPSSNFIVSSVTAQEFSFMGLPRGITFWNRKEARAGLA